MIDAEPVERPGLHVCGIGLPGSDPRGAWVKLANDSFDAERLTGRLVCTRTGAGEASQLYVFGSQDDGGPMLIEPFRSAYLFSGAGRDDRAGNGDLFLFAGRHSARWTGHGDVVELQEPDATVISSLTVAEGSRHPSGH
ncbi:MAG: hypothetical protein ACJ762_07300 [Solirubrobacteraceae bacterium]